MKACQWLLKRGNNKFFSPGSRHSQTAFGGHSWSSQRERAYPCSQPDDLGQHGLSMELQMSNKARPPQIQGPSVFFFFLVAGGAERFQQQMNLSQKCLSHSPFYVIPFQKNIFPIFLKYQLFYIVLCDTDELLNLPSPSFLKCKRKKIFIYVTRLMIKFDDLAHGKSPEVLGIEDA